MKQSNEDMARSHFAKDTERHVLTVFKDDGVYRHIRMAKPGDSNMRYDIVTWPGYLAYSGNMGDFTFSRVEDMFTFFRPENPGSVQPYINLSYWSEKITAADKNDGYRQYSGDMFEAAVKERLEEYIREREGIGDDEDAVSQEDDAIRELRQAVEDDVLSCSDDGIQAAYNAAHEFEFYGDAIFDGLGSRDMEDWSYRYVWCCLAVVHAIIVYDRWKSTQPIPLVTYPPRCENCGKDVSALTVMPKCRHAMCLECVRLADVIGHTFKCPLCGNKEDNG